MRIITVGESPYLLTKDGRIHADLLRSLKATGYHAESIVHNHDITHFLPSEAGSHYFEHGDGNRSRLHPAVGLHGSIPAMLMRLISRNQATAVVTIGDYGDNSFFGYIKARHPSMFKWVLLLTSGSTLVNEKHRERIMQADHIVTTTSALAEALRAMGVVNVEHIPYGPSVEFRRTGERPESFSALCPSKCVQNSNLGAFLKAAALSGVCGHLHTNHDDNGDYDIPLLISRYGIKDRVSLTPNYVSVREGISQGSMNDLYNRHHAVVDCSLQSGTGLSLLEAMATGCIPIGVGFGAVGEIIARMPEWCRFSVSFDTFVGPGQEEHAIVSTADLAGKLAAVDKMWKYDHESHMQASKSAEDVAQFFSKENFVCRVNEIIANVLLSGHAIVVDSY